MKGGRAAVIGTFLAVVLAACEAPPDAAPPPVASAVFSVGASLHVGRLVFDSADGARQRPLGELEETGTGDEQPPDRGVSS